MNHQGCFPFYFLPKLGYFIPEEEKSNSNPRPKSTSGHPSTAANYFVHRVWSGHWNDPCTRTCTHTGAHTCTRTHAHSSRPASGQDPPSDASSSAPASPFPVFRFWNVSWRGQKEHERKRDHVPLASPLEECQGLAWVSTHALGPGGKVNLEASSLEHVLSTGYQI